MGRGSSSTEFRGFGIPDSDTTREMFDEALPQILRMRKEPRYQFSGKFFAMPERNVLPKPFSKPHPPLWMACGNPATFEKAGRLGVGALCFSLGAPSDFEPLIRVYKENIRRAEPIGDYVNDNVACVTQLVCAEDGQEARGIACNMGDMYHVSLVFRYLDTFPHPPGIPPWPRTLPEPTLEELEERIRTGQRIVGDPEECARAVQTYVDIGCDQIIFGILASTQPQWVAKRSVELFGRYVVPRFDTDPMHSTTRYRLAALGQQPMAGVATAGRG